MEKKSLSRPKQSMTEVVEPEEEEEEVTNWINYCKCHLYPPLTQPS
jgi:hypothetical protein